MPFFNKKKSHFTPLFFCALPPCSPSLYFFFSPLSLFKTITRAALFLLVFLFSLPLPVRSVSGEVPEQPVVSRVSGALFEERLIRKHLVDHDTDPVNQEPMTTDDLIKLQGGLDTLHAQPAAAEQ